MGLRSNFKTARRAIFRRKSKNASAILAIALGVTLMVGVQITTETLSASFLISTLLSQGEVDIRVTNTTTGTYLSASEEAKIAALVPDAVGIMPELTILRPVSIGPQFEPSAEVAGLPIDYPEVFGSFYDWQTGEKMDIGSLLVDNTSALLSNELAENLGLNQSSSLPVILRTEFTNITVIVTINQTTFEPIFNTVFSTEKVEFSIVGIYDSNRPGIGAQTNANAGRMLLRLDQLQTFVSWQDPFRNTDIVETYLISLKSNHFAEEIEEDVLQEQVDNLLEVTPEVIDPMSGLSQKIYNINSFRLQFFGIAVFFITLLNAFLTTLGLLIMITGLLLITNVQLLAVEDKQFKTGVLRAIGEKRMGIFWAQFYNKK